MSQNLSQCLLCQMVPHSQRDLASSLKGKFLFYTPHLYFLKTPGQAGPAATLTSALISTSLGRKERRRGVSDLPCTVFSCLGLTPSTTKQRADYNISCIRTTALEISYFLTLRGGTSCACLQMIGFDLPDSWQVVNYSVTKCWAGK